MIQLKYISVESSKSRLYQFYE